MARITKAELAKDLAEARTALRLAELVLNAEANEGHTFTTTAVHPTNGERWDLALYRPTGALAGVVKITKSIPGERRAWVELHRVDDLRPADWYRVDCPEFGSAIERIKYWTERTRA